MKRAQSIDRDFKKLKGEIYTLEDIIKNSKSSALWEHEATIRKKMKALREFRNKNLPGFKETYGRYENLLDYISQKIIEDYNRRNETEFSFHEIIRGNYNAYIQSGVISVLFTWHIPKIVEKQFKKVFPKNPKDEYRETRKIKRKFYIHLGDTNTGKTYNAMERLKAKHKGVYLSPLRILALENFEKLNKEGVPCSLLTGEEEIRVEGAKHICSTIEKLDINEEYDVGVIDEIQLIGDDQRGYAWTRAMLALKAKEIHVCGAINAKELIINIIEDCNDEYEIKIYNREIPLIMEVEPFGYKKVREGDAIVAFSKKKVLEIASKLKNMGLETSVIYGDLPPEVRRNQCEKFANGDSKIVVATDAIGMGVNLPIKRIVFIDVKKFDGKDIRYLTSQEVKQISGRAGRIGIYDEGYVSVFGHEQDFINDMIKVPDNPIDWAVLGPSEHILNIKNIPLKEKLALWSTRDEGVDFYRKMDINIYLVILDSIKRYKLPENIQWRLMKVPLDITNPNIMNTFLSYIDEKFVINKEEISKPVCFIDDLDELEVYYQKINLYYSFSKAFDLKFDEEWVKEERKKVAIEINHILKEFL